MSNPLDALTHDQGLTLDGRPLNPPKDVSAYYPSRTDSNPEGRGRTIPPPRMSEERRKRVDEALEQAYEDTSPQPISSRYGRWTDSDILSEIMRRETDIQELYYLAIARGIPLADSLAHKWHQMYYVTQVMHALATGNAIAPPQQQSHGR